MKRTLFIFGRTPTLSRLELLSLYPKAHSVTPEIYEVSSGVDAQQLIHTLGGTVKIAEVAIDASEITAEQIVSLLISTSQSRRITFGISRYGGHSLSRHLTAEVKDGLTGRGYSARYIETTDDHALSSVVIAKQAVTDVVIISHNTTNIIAVTTAVQDFEDWNKRDFGRPSADPKKGMLPPKVARMIVNIALPNTDPAYHPTLLDPYCGVGTVLQEALLRGANVIGSDISESAVVYAKKNLEWLRREYRSVEQLYAKVIVSDATHISTQVAPHSCDAIVTEPFMGETVDVKKIPQLTPEHVKNILKGLEKLYIGSLKEWTGILKPGGIVVMAMPAYATGRVLRRVKNVVDRCESLGYTLLTGPIEYSRPHAIVRREFYVLKKNS